MKNNYIYAALIWLIFFGWLMMNHSTFNVAVDRYNNIDENPTPSSISQFSFIKHDGGIIEDADDIGCEAVYSSALKSKKYFNVKLEKYKSGGCLITYSYLNIHEYQYLLIYIFIFCALLTWLVIKNKNKWSIIIILLSIPAYFIIAFIFNIPLKIFRLGF